MLLYRFFILRNDFCQFLIYFLQIYLKTSHLRKNSPIIDKAMPYIERLASVLCDALRASSDFSQNDERDEDIHKVLVSSIDCCAVAIHQLIQIFAIDKFDERPATLACIQVVN